jgi:hypothetical protein
VPFRASLRRHVDARDASRGADHLRGDERARPRAGSEAEHVRALLDASKREWIGDARERLNRRVGDVCEFGRVVEVLRPRPPRRKDEVALGVPGDGRVCLSNLVTEEVDIDRRNRSGRHNIRLSAMSNSKPALPSSAPSPQLGKREPGEARRQTRGRASVWECRLGLVGTRARRPLPCRVARSGRQRLLRCGSGRKPEHTRSSAVMWPSSNAQKRCCSMSFHESPRLFTRSR